MTEHRPPGRRRLLSDHEIELWLQVTRNVAQLPGRVLPEKPAPKPDVPAPAPPVKKPPTLPAYVPPQSAPRSGPPPLAPIERKLKQRLARGRTEIEAAIDLHGMRQAEAQAALNGFLMRAQAEGRKLVLVVTGKGKPGLVDASGFEREPGVLRRVVPLWLRALELRGLVVGFDEAASTHGGAGAIYVRLRRGTRGTRRDP